MELRLEGFQDKMAEIASEVELLEIQVIETWQKDESIEEMEVALTNYPQIDGGHGQTDTIAVGMASAADDAGRVQDMVIVGIDGTIDGFTAIKTGKMYATVLQHPIDAADAVYDTAVKILKGQDVSLMWRLILRRLS